MQPEAIDMVMLAAAKNGQLVLLNDVLRWAKSYESGIDEDARVALLELVSKYA